MSIRIMSSVFDSKTLKPTERLVMLALADHADDSGRCYPSNSRLQERTGLSERAIRQNVQTLRESGHLTVIFGAGQAGANVYILRADGAVDAPGSKCPPGRKCTPPRQQVPPDGAADAPKPSGTITEPPVDRARRQKPEVELPDGWVPNIRNIADAADRKFTAKETEDEADRFRNHHHAKGSRFRDWNAAWRTWLGNARKFAGRSMAGQTKPNGYGQGSSIACIAARRRLAGQV